MAAVALIGVVFDPFHDKHVRIVTAIAAVVVAIASLLADSHSADLILGLYVATRILHIAEPSVDKSYRFVSMVILLGWLVDIASTGRSVGIVVIACIGVLLSAIDITVRMN